MPRLEIMDVYEPLFREAPTYKFIKSGRTAGKSFQAGIKVVKSFFEKDDDIVVFRANLSSIGESIHNEILDVIDTLGLIDEVEIRKKPLRVHNKINGNIIYYLGVGGADLHRTKGFKPHKRRLSLIVGEELQQIADQRNLDEAMATFLRYLMDYGEVLYLMNPDRRASHWCNEYFRLSKTNEDFLCLHTSYKDIAKVLNKHILREIELERITNPSNYRHRFLGETEGLFGAVYSTFDRSIHLVTEEQVKDLIKNVGVHTLLIGGDPAYTIDATALVPVLLFRNGQAIALNYFFHDPQVDGALSNISIAPLIKKWLMKDVIDRWDLNQQSRVDLVFDINGRELLNHLEHSFLPPNFRTQVFSQKNVVEMAQHMNNAFSKNLLFILDEGGIYNYKTNRFMHNKHPLVSQLEQVVWNENGDGFEKKVPNDATDALTYAISFYFKNPANITFPRRMHYYKPLPKERVDK